MSLIFHESIIFKDKYQDENIKASKRRLKNMYYIFTSFSRSW